MNQAPLHPPAEMGLGEYRMPLERARQLAQELMMLLASACARIEIAGSIRRGKETVKDAELVAIPGPDLRDLTNDLHRRGVVDKARYGEKGTHRWGSVYRGMLYKGLRVELFMTNADSWGYQYWLRTGPAEANAFVMRWLNWVRAPISAKDGAWWYGERRLRVATEEEMFELLGIRYVPPEKRSEMLYRIMLEDDAHEWPDFSRFYIEQQGNLLEAGRSSAANNMESDTLPATDKEMRWQAERTYHQQVMARHREIFIRAAAGLPLEAWEVRIVCNRIERTGGLLW
jgi:hypothetical protein